MKSTATEWIKIVMLFVIAGGVVGGAIQSKRDADRLADKMDKVARQIKARPAADDGPDEPEGPVDFKPYLTDSDLSMGPEDAKVTLIEFSDFQCPFCKRFAADTAPLIRADYGDRIRIVFKHLPLRAIHPHAQGAAVAAECAGQQGKFWPYYDIVFKNQSNLATDALARYAQEIGADMKKFRECVSSPEVEKKIEKDLEAAQRMGVNGTPGFIINGTKISGAQPFANFKAAIDKAIAEAN